MRIPLAAVVAFAASMSTVSLAQDPPDKRWSGWCEYRQLPGERFPAPRLNLPQWACEAAFDANLHKKYSVHSAINPFYIAGDFNGDGRLDVALWVAERRSRKLGLAILHRGQKAPVILAAGKPWENRDDNFAGLDMWSSMPKHSQLESVHEENRKVKLQGDAIVLMKSESHAFAIYWNGKTYASYQLSD